MSTSIPADELLARITAMQAGAAPGASTDALTQAILDKLNEEVARVYAEASAEAGVPQNDGAEEGGSPAKTAASNMDGSAAGYAAGLNTSNRPRPVDLWRAAHEVDRAPKEKVIMTQDSWEELVSRLNASGKKKEVSLLQAQHKQLKDQLAGLTFTPHINGKSRELAELNKALPERVSALMRKKKAKLDRIRNEKAERELAGATFKPNLNKPKTPVDGIVRRVGHLMQYEIDRRVRAEQRRALIQELEDRELRFQPKINKNSARIVNRLKAEADSLNASSLTEAGAAAAAGSPVTASKSAKKALVETLAQGRPLGRSFLPGHEQETFQPTINERSRTLHRPGVDDIDVFTRLYVHGAGSTGAPAAGGSVADGGDDDGADGAAAGGGGYGGLDGADVGPTHPRHFNTIAYDSSSAAKHDFILRRLLSGAGAGYE